MARLAFFGTPNFSLPALRAVWQFCRDFSHELSLVVSQADKPQGRGKLLKAPPVKQLALDLNLVVAQPITLKRNTDEGDRFFEQFVNLDIDLAIVVAYGKIITERLLMKPKSGFVNVHASILPRFRGAAPVQRAIEAGDHETGISLMDMVKKLDEGDVYICEKTTILPFDTSETLLRRLAHMGASMLYNNLESLLQKKLTKVAQASSGIVYAHMLKNEEGLLNFLLPGNVISKKVLAFDPWPGAFGFIRGKRVKFFDSFFIAGHPLKEIWAPGTVVVADSFLGVRTVDGIVYFQGIQVEGKKALSIRKALLSFPIAVGERIDIKARLIK
jgi:methionyl-tRNA formyltransferase